MGYVLLFMVKCFVQSLEFVWVHFTVDLVLKKMKYGSVFETDIDGRCCLYYVQLRSFSSHVTQTKPDR